MDKKVKIFARRALSGALSALLVLLSPGWTAFASAAGIFKSKAAAPIQAAQASGLKIRSLSHALPPAQTGALNSFPSSLALPAPSAAPKLDIVPLPGRTVGPAGPAQGQSALQAPSQATEPNGSQASAENSWAKGRESWNHVAGTHETEASETVPVSAASPLASFSFPQEAGMPRGHFPPGGGSAAPPGPPAPPAPAGPRAKWQDFKAAVSSLWVILPDLPDKPETRGRNKEFWKYILFSALNVVGVSFHYPALSGLIAPHKEDAPNILGSRVVTFSADATSSLSMGALVNNSSMKKVLGLTSGARAVVMMAVPILFFALSYGNPALLTGLVFLVPFMIALFSNSFLHGAGSVASGMAFNTLVAGYDSNTYNRAEAYFSIMLGLAQMVGFLAAGFFIGWTGHLFLTAHAGNALAYGVYALFLAAAAVIAGRFLRLPQNPLWKARKELASRLKPHSFVKRVSLTLENKQEALQVEVSALKPLQDTISIPKIFNGYPVFVVPQRHVLKELGEGFALIIKDRFLRLTLIFSTLYMIISDALVFSTLQRYMQDSLHLSDNSGAFSYFFAAMAIGQIVASLWLTRSRAAAEKTAQAQPQDGKPVMTPLDKQGRMSSILNGLGMLCYWGVFFAPNLWLSVAAMAAGSMLQGVAAIIWTTLDRQVLKKYPRAMGKIMAARNFYHTLCAIAGLFLFLIISPLPFKQLLGVTIPNFPLSTNAILWISCALLTMVGILDFIEPFVVLPLNRGAKPSDGAKKP